jgi:AraC-like DNA-binding protein
MREKLELARELALCLGGVEVQMVSLGDASIERFIDQSLYGSILPLTSAQQIRDGIQQMLPGCLYILGGVAELFYAVIRADESRFLCVGPCLHSEFSESRCRAALRPFRLSSTATEQAMAYCRWQPVLTPERLHRLGIVLGSLVLGLPEPIPHRRIDYRWNQFVPVEIPEEASEEFRIRCIEQRYEASAALTEAVKQGNLSLAYSLIQGFHPDRSQISRNPNPLRNAQNICLIMNTQLRCALEECNVHPFRLDSVSHAIALAIENLDTPDAAGQFCAQIVRRYCELALEDRYSGLNRLAQQAVMYIKSHLADNLTVRDTAEVLLVNANYLSGVFRRELGMPFITFVNQQRAQQAASLLRHTNMQIQHIAAAVGYNNTSYFTRQFSAVFGCTPRQYRAQGLL